MTPGVAIRPNDSFGQNAQMGSRQQNASRTRERLAAAADQLFRKKGYEATTVSEISEAAGLSRRTFFRHFRSKDELVFGDVELYQSTLVRAAVGASEGGPKAMAAAGILAVAELVDADRDLMWQRVRMMLRGDALKGRVLELHLQWRVALAHTISAQSGRDRPTIEEWMTAATAVAAHEVATLAWATEPDASVAVLTKEALLASGLL